MSCFQKQQLDKDTPEKKLATMNKKILELKKKIQLSEGQKKAFTEELALENKNNTKKISSLKKEIKILIEKLHCAKLELGGEKQFRLAKYLHELGPIASKDNEQLKQILDLKVIDIHKQLDVLRYKRKKKKLELNKLEAEYQKLAADRSLVCQSVTGGAKSNRKTLSRLENEIHRFTVQWMEAEHIRKKYSGIRLSLLNDSVKFESALKKTEDMIKEQNVEINRLQEINKSAIEMRDSAMSALVQEEQRVLKIGTEREVGLSIARKKLADRRAELERLERRIFPQARSTLMQQDSVGSVELDQIEEGNNLLIGGHDMDEIFQKLMKATGVSDPEHVFDRFKGQKSTTERLVYLKNTTETEKKQLEEEQNIILAELEAYKFAEGKDKEENQEEMDNLKNQIQIVIETKEKYEGELRNINEILLDIKRSFYDCCLKLEDADTTVIPDWSHDLSNIGDIFDLLKRKYVAATLMIQEEIQPVTESPPPQDKEGAENPPLEKVMSEDRTTFPAAYRELLAPRTKSRGTGTPSGAKPAASDEEDEIPSRGFLKRQAQLIVDTKSRRKGYRPARN